MKHLLFSCLAQPHTMWDCETSKTILQQLHMLMKRRSDPLTHAEAEKVFGAKSEILSFNPKKWMVSHLRERVTSQPTAPLTSDLIAEAEEKQSVIKTNKMKSLRLKKNFYKQTRMNVFHFESWFKFYSNTSFKIRREKKIVWVPLKISHNALPALTSYTPSSGFPSPLHVNETCQSSWCWWQKREMRSLLPSWLFTPERCAPPGSRSSTGGVCTTRSPARCVAGSHSPAFGGAESCLSGVANASSLKSVKAKSCRRINVNPSRKPFSSFKNCAIKVVDYFPLNRLQM